MSILNALKQEAKRSRYIWELAAWIKTAYLNQPLAVGGTTALTGLLLFYVAIWNPAAAFSKRSTDQYKVNAELLAWMKAHETQARAMNADGTHNITSPAGSLLSVVDSLAKNYSVVLQRYEPNGEDGIRVWLENAEFNSVVQWLEQLAIQHIQVSSVSIDKKPTEGRVDARLELSSF